MSKWKQKRLVLNHCSSKGFPLKYILVLDMENSILPGHTNSLCRK